MGRAGLPGSGGPSLLPAACSLLNEVPRDPGLLCRGRVPTVRCCLSRGVPGASPAPHVCARPSVTVAVGAGCFYARAHCCCCRSSLSRQTSGRHLGWGGGWIPRGSSGKALPAPPPQLRLWPTLPAWRESLRSPRPDRPPLSSLLLPEPPGGVGCGRERVPGRWGCPGQGGAGRAGRTVAGRPCCVKSRRGGRRPLPVSRGHTVCSPAQAGVRTPSAGLCRPSLCCRRPSVCFEGLGLSAPAPKLPVRGHLCVFCGRRPPQVNTQIRCLWFGGGGGSFPGSCRADRWVLECTSLSPPRPAPPRLWGGFAGLLPPWKVQLGITVPNPALLHPQQEGSQETQPLVLPWALPG